jgi:hypothetical protein
MNQRTEPSSYVISYLNLRKTVGCIAILLPLGLGAGVIVLGSTIPSSVSGYYYSPMRNVLVAALCVLGMFLITYNGYDSMDSWVTNVAGGAAIGVAFFPTSSPSFSPAWVGSVHPVFAGVALTAQALMALQFTSTDTDAGGGWVQDLERMGLALLFRYSVPQAGQAPGSRKMIRNRIYSGCAWAILVGVALALMQNFWPPSVKQITPWLFWFEALAIMSFGFSWLVKGEAILADKPIAATVQPAETAMLAARG